MSKDEKERKSGQTRIKPDLFEDETLERLEQERKAEERRALTALIAAEVSSQIKVLEQSRPANEEDLAAKLEPLAQAMAALTRDSMQALLDLRARSEQAHDLYQSRIEAFSKELELIRQAASDSARTMDKAAERVQAKGLIAILGTAAVTAALAIVSWPSRDSPKVVLDATAVVEQLKAAGIGAATPSTPR